MKRSLAAHRLLTRVIHPAPPPSEAPARIRLRRGVFRMLLHVPRAL